MENNYKDPNQSPEMAKLFEESINQLKGQNSIDDAPGFSEDMYKELREESGEEHSESNEDGMLPSYDYAIQNVPNDDEIEEINIQNKPSDNYYDDMEEQLNIDPYDYAIYEGGPLKSEVEVWKKTYAEPYYSVSLTDILGHRFVFRTLNRFEYKQVCALQNSNALTREEVICKTCVLYPYNFDWKSISVGRAGIPSTLSQVIMESSGFTQNYQIQVL